MKRLSAALIVLLFANPSHAETTAFAAPNGAKVFTTKCSSDELECYQEARQTCRGSYQILSSHSYSGGLLFDMAPGPINKYVLKYQCGPSDGRLATFPHQGGYYVPPRLHTDFCEFGYNNLGCVGVY